jgi:hypothetical protein
MDKPNQGGMRGPTNTMTAGGIGCLAIYKFILGECKTSRDFANYVPIKAGIAWLSNNFQQERGKKMDAAKKGSGLHKIYWADAYLAYAVERAGILAEFSKLGQHDWYKEGADWLVRNQNADGCWDHCSFRSRSVLAETCLAILFLKKATEPLFETH